jgi:hypothetical protein
MGCGFVVKLIFPTLRLSWSRLMDTRGAGQNKQTNEQSINHQSITGKRKDHEAQQDGFDLTALCI